MNCIKEDSNHFNGGVKESSQQQDGEESAFQLNELFEAKNYQTEDEIKAGQSSYKLNTIKKTFNKQIKSYILSLNEGQMNTKQLKVQLQINNLKAQTLIFQVFIHKISLDITAVSSKDQILRLKIYPGARFELNSSILQQIGAHSSVLGASLADKGQNQINRKHKSEENTSSAINQTQQSLAEEQIPINGNANGTVAFKQILSQQYSQDSKFLQNNEECYLSQNSQDKSLLIPSILAGQSANNQNQQQQQLIQKQQGNINFSNNPTQNNISSQNNSVYVFNAPSDFLLKDKWINLIVDLKSFFKDVNDDFVVKNIEIGSQCRLKSIFYSKQSDLRASLISKHDLIVNSGTNKFIPQVINFQQVSQMIDDSSPKHGQRKSQSNNINFLLPQCQAIQANSQTADINSSNVETSLMIHNSIALPAKTPNKSNKYQNRYSVHLSNYKHSQVALQQAQNAQVGSSKSYSKQPPPPLIQQQQSPSYHTQVPGVSSTSASNTSTNPGSAQLSKIVKRRESKNGYSGNISTNNQSFQQQQLPNSQSMQYNQNSYLSNNISFEQPHQGIGHSHLNSQNILFYQSTSQSTHPNCVLNSDEESTKCLYSGPNTQRTSSVYFYNAKRSSRSNVSGIQQQPSYHANSHHQYQNSYLNNSIAAGSGNNLSINPNSGQLNNNNNSIRLPKIISLLKQRSSSIYSGVTNRSHQIVEELDIASVQNVSNINSTRRAKDQSRIYQANNLKSPNNSVSNNNINQGISNNQNKLTLNNNKITSGIEQLLTQNVSNSPSKSNINTSRTHQKHYKSSQQRFVTVSINQSPKNKNQTQNTIPNFDLLPNNTSIHYPNSNDLYNIADQGLQNNEEDFKIQKRIRSEDDNDDINMSIKPENSKLSVMSKLSTVLFKNSIINASNQNKENDPRSRNTPALKKEKYVNLNNKRRSSLFSTEQNKPAQLSQNCQTINSINTINAKGSIQTSRRQNSINQQQLQNANQQQTQQQCLQYLTQQSSIQNDEDQPNIDYSQYAYYAPKNKKTKFQSQSPSQIMTHRSGNMSVKKSYGNCQSNNKNCQMQILNSPQQQQQQSPLSNQKSYIRNSYSIINKRQSAAAVNYKQNSVQINQSINNSEELQLNNDTNSINQNDKSERKKKIVMQQQYLQNKDSFCHEIQQNSSHSQPQQKIGGGTSRANYHHSPPPPLLKNHRETSQENVSSHIQQTKSKISLIPSHVLQYSLQTQIAQTNPSNTLQISINQGYQPQQSLSQAKTTKKQLHHQQFTGPTPSKSNSRNQSPLVNKIANSGKTSHQQIGNSNSINNGVNLKIEVKSNSLERNSLTKKPSTTNNNQLVQNLNSPKLKRNIQKSTFSNENKQNKSVSNEKKNIQNNTQSSDKKNKAQMGLDFSKISTTVNKKQDILLKNTAAANVIFKTEEVQDDEDQNTHAQKKLAQRKISEGQESPSKGKEKNCYAKKNLLQAFNQAEDNTDRINIQNQQITPQNEEFEDEQKVIEQNEIYKKNVHRFSSTYNNPELSLPLTLLQKNLQQTTANQNGSHQSSEPSKALFQNGILKSQPIALTASNLLNIKDQQQEQLSLNQDIAENQNKKLNNNSSLQKDKQYKRKYQQNQFQKKKSKSNSDTVIKAQEYEELAEEIIESQQSEHLLTNPINTNQDDVIEEKIETKSISITNQSKSIISDIDKKNEIMLKTSGSVYESQHMTSSEEECNESGLAISIQVDNIDIKEDLDIQKIPPQYKKQKSSAKKKENDTVSPTEKIKKKQESGNKFIQEIEKQIPSSNSIEVSKVLIVQDDDDDEEEYNKQLISQINSLPYTSDWRIQSFLIENKTDILKNRINLSNLINGVTASCKTQPVETILSNQVFNQNLQNKPESNNNNNDQQQNFHSNIDQNQNKLPTNEKRQNNHSKIFGNPQILQLTDVIKASE
ncbi:hypothetical protein TTHERM_00474880 (macronuclear) [Tetrahymena thermophila SB210]|uniref:Uncharacterized protein n=1 Tax=Tetrahymena thermophila (strain SB210) TaxID=312017 RepID=I7M3M1_TETTS|nr:hypothetical protein TTHERM_00474880 [Tetrahymena thermophila SB210]EAS03725.2 hypothetical protein TTHERM_00474880 [Tetrahymena thermophila SB210]|eukprot:XP_001023970.2 hypothetical protein TTHERM_00474880 [Tetrahymena thermophila SB210]